MGKGKQKEVQTVFTKYAEVKRPKEFKFYGIVSHKGEKDKLLIVEAQFRGQAERFLNSEAKKLRGTLTTVGAM